MIAVEVKQNQTVKEVYDKKGQYDYSNPNVVKVMVSGYSYFVYHNNPGNCKVCTISNLQSAMSGVEHVKVFDRIDELFKSSMKLVFRTTFTDAQSMEAVAKRYKLLYKVKIPIGYGNGMQYHCAFMIGNVQYPSYDIYLRRIEAVGNELPVTIPKPKPAPIPGPNQILVTREQLEKLRTYKTDVWANKFINKLVNGEDPQ